MPRGTSSQPDDVTRVIARELRVEMTRQDITRGNLIQATGMSQSTIQRIVSGTRVADIVELQEICKVLHISWVDLLGNAQREVLERTNNNVTELRPTPEETTTSAPIAARRSKGKLQDDAMGDDA